MTERLSLYLWYHSFSNLSVHRCEASGSMRACHAVGPGSIPGREKFPGWCFFRGFSSPVRQMLGSFRPPMSPNIIWPSLSSSLIHYGRQWPEMLTCLKTSNIHPTLPSLYLCHSSCSKPFRCFTYVAAHSLSLLLLFLYHTLFTLRHLASRPWGWGPFKYLQAELVFWGEWVKSQLVNLQEMFMY